MLKYTYGVLDYEFPSNDCTQHGPTLGRSIFCCTGGCSDGTNIFTSTGLCQGWHDSCKDPAVPPQCPSNQVYSNVTIGDRDPGLGNCWVADTCQWDQLTYSYSCCECGPGYTSVTGGQCGDFGRGCVGCTENGETLAMNGTDYYCHRGVSCDIVRCPTSQDG